MVLCSWLFCVGTFVVVLFLGYFVSCYVIVEEFHVFCLFT